MEGEDEEEERRDGGTLRDKDRGGMVASVPGSLLKTVE